MGLFPNKTKLGKLLATKPGGTGAGKLLKSLVGEIPAVGKFVSSFVGNGAPSPSSAPGLSLPAMAFSVPEGGVVPAPAPTVLQFTTHVPDPIPVPSSQSVLPMGGTSAQVTNSLSAENKGLLSDIFKAGLGGMQSKVTEVFLDTPSGRKAKKAGAESWVKDNLAAVIGAAMALVILIVLAFKKK
jgi:hypothetical protein